MSTVLLCWELGDGFGHLYPLLPIARALSREGFEVAAAVRDPGRARQVLGGLEVDVRSCPLGTPLPGPVPFSLNYAENLLRNGYEHADALEQSLRAWGRLFDDIEPDFVLADHAPTGLLAARARGLPRGAIGTGLALPPAIAPMPSLQPWFEVPPARLREAEDRCLGRINKALAACGHASLGAVCDIFEGARVFMTMFAELDHYGPRATADYLGPVLSSDEAPLPLWPEAGLEDGRRIFLYLDRGYPHLARVLELIRKTGMPALAVVPGLPEKDRETAENETSKVVNGPVSFRQAARECDLAVTHGGFNTTNLVLLAGKPLLILPTQLDQTLFAYRLSRQGLAAMVNGFHPEPDISAKLELLIHAEALGSRARDFAERYRDHDPARPISEIVGHVSREVSRRGVSSSRRSRNRSWGGRQPSSSS